MQVKSSEWHSILMLYKFFSNDFKFDGFLKETRKENNFIQNKTLWNEKIVKQIDYSMAINNNDITA